MNAVIKVFLERIASFLGEKRRRRLFCLAALAALALADYFSRGALRRNFVFHTVYGNKLVVEDRMLPKGGTEENIRRYVEETLGGPVSLELNPLFNNGTTLESLLFRDGNVFINFSAEAELPPLEGNQDLYHNLSILNEGIYRNFPYVKENHFFIGGREAFLGGFGAIGRDRLKQR